MKQNYILIGAVFLLGIAFIATGALGSASLFFDKPSDNNDVNSVTNICNWQVIDINGYTFDSVSDMKDYVESQGKSPNYSDINFKMIDGQLNARPASCGDSQ